MRQPNINKKYLTNKKSDNEANNKVDKKAYLKQLSLKQEIKRCQV